MLRYGMEKEMIRLTTDSSSAITNFVVLTFAQLNQQFGYLVFYFHATEDCRSIVGHSDVSIRRNENLVKTART